MIEQTLGEYLEKAFGKDNPKVRCITRSSNDDIRQSVEFAREGKPEASRLSLMLAMLPKTIEKEVVGDYDLVNVDNVDEERINLAIELYLANRDYTFEKELSHCSKRFVKEKEMRAVNISRQGSGYRITDMIIPYP